MKKIQPLQITFDEITDSEYMIAINQLIANQEEMNDQLQQLWRMKLRELDGWSERLDKQAAELDRRETPEKSYTIRELRDKWKKCPRVYDEPVDEFLDWLEDN